MRHNFIASLAGPSPKLVAQMATDLPAFSNSRPLSLWIDDEERSIDEDWRRQLLSGTSNSWARWNLDGQQFHQISIRLRSDLVVVSIPDGFSSVEEALAILEPLPFEVGALGSRATYQWLKEDLDTWGFSRSHLSHGWGCIFRGAGHERLVSRRWLEFGPWRIIRRPNDTTLVQFFDLAITNPAETYEQAKAGHERMGLSNIGGFIQQIEDWMLADVRGAYFAHTRTLDIVVAPGLSVTKAQMLNACALRLHHRLTRPTATPVEHVAYIFIDEADARAHLHELWLRELQCWAFDAQGKKRRLDLDYHPVPDPPAWVRRLDGH